MTRRARPTDEWSELEQTLGYRFRDAGRVTQALTHKSCLNEPKAGGRTENNERLEFLGDAVLNLIMTEELSARHPAAREGALSKMRARLVSEATLAQVAHRLGLGKHLRLGRGEELSGGREKPSLLADAFEAVTATIYLDGGYAAAQRSVLAVMEPEFGSLAADVVGFDFKTQVQERCQRLFGVLPVYRVSRETGPDHRKSFQVEVTIAGQQYGVGTGNSKKTAEQQAAKMAWERLERQAQVTFDKTP